MFKSTTKDSGSVFTNRRVTVPLNQKMAINQLMEVYDFLGPKKNTLVRFSLKNREIHSL